MRKFSRLCLSIACALLVHCLCIACALQKHSVTDTHTIEYRDTTHIDFVTIVRDTAHVDTYHTEHTQIVEQYDPRTGALQKRIIDIDKTVKELRDELTSRQEEIDMLRAQLAASEDTHNELQVEEKTTSAWNWWVFVAAAILAAAIGWPKLKKYI